MTGVRSKIHLLLIGLAGYILLLLPATFNGAPIYWPDSVAYLHGGSTALAVATNIDTRYQSIEKGRPGPEAATAPYKPQTQPPEITPAPPPSEYRVSAARSPYYAVFLAGVSSAMGLNGPVYVQALLILLSFTFLIRAIFPDKPEKPSILMLCAVALTASGLFAAALLPDFLAPLALLSVAVLFSLWPRLRHPDRIFWFCVLLISILCHNTHLAMTLFLLPFAILFSRVILKRRIIAPCMLVLSAIALGILGNMVFTTMVERHYGYKPQSFPMIAASLIVDGPGRGYLEATCPQNGYVYCDHLDTKATEIDQYLWSYNSEVGVYSLADRQTKDRMSAEQWRFLMDTLRYDFPGQCKASLERMLRQLKNNSLDQFYYGTGIRNLLRTLPAHDWVPISSSALFKDQFPLSTLSHISQWVGWSALAAVMIFLGRAALKRSDSTADAQILVHRELVVLTLVICIGFLINAGLTGAASQPQGRYSARIFLLFPVLLSVWVSVSLRFPQRPRVSPAP